MWQSTLLNKCEEDTDSHFFYSLRKQPKFPDWLKFASTNQHEQPKSEWCRVVSMFFFSTLFSDVISRGRRREMLAVIAGYIFQGFLLLL